MKLPLIISIISMTITNSFYQTPETNLKMQVKVSGEGRPILLVPGGLTGWNSWEPFVEIFSAKHRQSIRVQLLNVQYGIEDRPLPGDYSVGMESRTLAATLDSLELSKPIDIVAWSYGALIALDFALDHPQKVRTLTLIEPPAIWVLEEKDLIDAEVQKLFDFLGTLHGHITEDMLAAFLQEGGLVKEGYSARDIPQWEQWLPYRQSLRNSPAVLAHTDHLERLENFRQPVLLIKGAGSARYLHLITDVLATHLPDVHVIELQGGHASHIVSKDQFLLELESFQKE